LQQVIDDQLPVALTYVTGPDTLCSHSTPVQMMRCAQDLMQQLAKQRYQAQYEELQQQVRPSCSLPFLEDTGNSGRGSKVWQERFGAFQ
jgi:hypothetical protein